MNQKKQYIKEYIRSLKAIEDCIEPYQEQKRELRSEFRNNGWLNTDEIRAAVKAYRLFKHKVNIDEVLLHIADRISHRKAATTVNMIINDRLCLAEPGTHNVLANNVIMIVFLWKILFLHAFIRICRYFCI